MFVYYYYFTFRFESDVLFLATLGEHPPFGTQAQRQIDRYKEHKFINIYLRDPSLVLRWVFLCGSQRYLTYIAIYNQVSLNSTPAGPSISIISGQTIVQANTHARRHTRVYTKTLTLINTDHAQIIIIIVGS